MKDVVTGQGRIVLAELSERQKAVLTDAVARVQAAARQYEAVKQEYHRLVAMAMPDGATGLDLEKGVFYYEKPVPPLALVKDEEDEED